MWNGHQNARLFWQSSKQTFWGLIRTLWFTENWQSLSQKMSMMMTQRRFCLSRTWPQGSQQKTKTSSNPQKSNFTNYRNYLLTMTRWPLRKKTQIGSGWDSKCWKLIRATCVSVVWQCVRTRTRLKVWKTSLPTPKLCAVGSQCNSSGKSNFWWRTRHPSSTKISTECLCTLQSRTAVEISLET